MQRAGPAPEEILSIVTDFYCSLTSKKDIHQMVSQIRQFVFSRASIVHKDYVAKLLVDYFLKLQVKLVTKSQQEWDVMFELSTARDRACLSLSKFPTRYAYRSAMKKLKEFQYLNQSYVVEMGDTQMTQMTEMDDMEIDQDIKMKTKYFFKWCLYLRQAKQFRQYKQKDIENLKISQVFNNYGMKFNYFTAWKHFCKKKKSLKDKEDLIKTKCQNKILNHCMGRIKEIMEIISIQDQLSGKVQELLMDCRKKQTFKRLHNNKLKNKLLTRKVKKNENIYYYRFLRKITQNKKYNLSKAFVVKRKQCFEIENSLIQKKIFNFLKKSYSDKKLKIHQIQEQRKNLSISKLNQNYSYEKQLMEKEKTLKELLKTKRVKVVITILHFSMLTQEVQTRMIEGINASGSLKTQTNEALFQVNADIKIKEKTKICSLKISSIFKKRLFEKLILRKNQSMKSYEKRANIQQLMKRRVFSHYRQLKTNLLSTKDYFQKLSEERNEKILEKSFKKLKKLKKYHKLEAQALEKMHSLHLALAKEQFWNKFKRQVQQKQCIIALSEKMTAIINRLVFLKIAGRTVRLNLQVQKFKSKKEKQGMRKLFDLLIKNISYSESQCKKIEMYHIQVSKSVLLKKLKLNQYCVNKQKSVIDLKDKNLKKNFFKNFMALYEEQKTCCQKYSFLAKKTFLNYLLRSTYSNIEKESIITEKSEQLQNFLKMNEACQFVTNLERNLKRKEDQNAKMYETAKILARRGTEGIKKSINLMKVARKRQQKQKKVQTKRKSFRIKDFLFEFKEKKLNKFFYETRVTSNFKNLSNILILDVQQTKKLYLLSKLIERNSSSMVFKLLQKNRLALRCKEKKLNETLQKKNGICKKLFIELIRENKENIENESKLLQRRTHKHLSELITTTFRGKFNRMKFNCSLKNYARNLLKKGFKGLKRTHLKVKYKENIQRLDKSSSIVMEKSIEKSMKSNTLSDQIDRFNQRKNKQSLSRAI